MAAEIKRSDGSGPQQRDIEKDDDGRLRLTGIHLRVPRSMRS